MQATDLMTTDVVTVSPDTSTREIAQVLLEHTISAVPVVDDTGSPVGMVSEGDLIGRDDAERDMRRDWWLAMLADGEMPSPDIVKASGPSVTTARQVMMAPVVTVTETTEAAEIARVLSAYRIKRVPVVRDGRIVGIVSRADLLRALVAETHAQEPEKRPGLVARTLDRIDRRFHQNHRAPLPQKYDTHAIAHAEELLNASDLRALVSDYKHEQTRRHDEERRAAADRRRAKVRDLIDHHIEDENWQGIMHRAREAAEKGETDLMILRFPSQLCSDGGRAINAPTPDWPTTLRGEAAEIYLRWEHDLKPHGFHLTARVLEFPGGVPGDIGLFLVWGE